MAQRFPCICTNEIYKLWDHTDTASFRKEPHILVQKVELNPKTTTKKLVKGVWRHQVPKYVHPPLKEYYIVMPWKAVVQGRIPHSKARPKICRWSASFWRSTLWSHETKWNIIISTLYGIKRVAFIPKEQHLNDEAWGWRQHQVLGCFIGTETGALPKQKVSRGRRII